MNTIIIHRNLSRQLARFLSSTAPCHRVKMSLSLDYEPSRADDLKHNIEAVLSEIKDAAPSGSKVSEGAIHLVRFLT
jgi:hypothetical protein